jgi:hypothetical protein
MIPAAILSIIFSVAQIVVPEVDAIAARHLAKGKCYELTFSRDRSAAWMREIEVCPDKRQLAFKAH